MRKDTPFLKKSIGEHIKVIKMKDAHIVDGEVEPRGWEKVIHMDSQFVLISNERFVNKIKANVKFFMDVVVNFNRVSRTSSNGDTLANIE